MLKKIAAFTLAALLAVCCCAPALAAGNSIDITVTVGFSGCYVVGSLTPVIVTIKNSGPEINGSIEMETGANTGILVRRDVVLPQGTTKQFTLFAQLNGISKQNSDFEVRLLSGGKVVQTAMPQNAAVQALDPSGCLGGILSDDASGITYLKKIVFTQYSGTNWVDLSIADINDDARLLQSFRILAVNNFDAAQLTDGQRAAVQQWVAEGGTLLLGAGPGREAGLSAWQELLQGVTVGGSTVASDLSQLSSLAIGAEFTGKLPISTLAAPGWSTVASAPEQPLILEKRLGQGSVYLTAFDMGAEAAQWSGNAAMWQTVLAQSSSISMNKQGMGFDSGYNILQALQQGMDSGNLTFVVFLLLLAVFVLLAGYGSYFLLKRLGRQKLMWLSVPALAVVFSAAILLGGRTSFGKSPESYAFSATRIAGGGAQSERTVAFSAPAMGDYRLSVKDNRFLLPVNAPNYNNYGNSYGSVAVKPPITAVVNTDTSDVRFLSVNLNGNRMASFSTAESGAPLQADFTYDGSMVQCHVTNTTEWVVEDTAAFIGGDTMMLGELAPGEEKTFTLGLDQTPVDQSFWNVTSTLYPQNYNGMMGVFTASSPAEREKGMKRTLLQSQQMMFTATSGGKLGTAYCIGWIKRPFNYQVGINGRAVTPKSLELLMLSQDIAQTGGMETRKLLPSISATSSPDASLDPNGMLYVGPGGPAVLDFKIGDSAGIEWQKATVSLGNGGGGGGTWTIYNFQTGMWDSMYADASYPGDQLKQYISPDGILRLSVKVGQNDRGSYSPVILMQGVKK